MKTVISIDKLKWENFGKAAANKGISRSELLEGLIRDYVKRMKKV